MFVCFNDRIKHFIKVLLLPLHAMEISSGDRERGGAREMGEKREEKQNSEGERRRKKTRCVAREREKRGRLFSPPLLAMEFSSGEREPGEESKASFLSLFI